jgi:hypothetical protein
MDDAKNAAPDYRRETFSTIMSTPMPLGANQFYLTVKCCAEPVTIANLLNEISQLLRSLDVYEISISGCVKKDEASLPTKMAPSNGT